MLFPLWTISPTAEMDVGAPVFKDPVRLKLASGFSSPTLPETVICRVLMSRLDGFAGSIDWMEPVRAKSVVLLLVVSSLTGPFR